MPHYLVYLGEREGEFSVNSRVQPGFKYRVRNDLPFKIDDGDIWMASLRGMQVLSTLNFVPTIKRQAHGDPTYCSPWEGAFLEGLAANCPDPARVVEIGTGKGTSLERIMYGLSLHEDVRVWTIDLLEQEEAKDAMEADQVPNWRYEFLVGNSAELGKAKWEPLDLVLVDGSHSYEGVKADIEAWVPHVKESGVMVFHDYKNRKHRVTKAVDEGMVNPWCPIGQVGSMIAFTREP
jgi:protein-L-isoaspartate O-methyltransferase